MSPVTKEELANLFEALPKDPTWDDVLQAVNLRVLMEERIALIGTKPGYTDADIRARYNLDK